MDGLKPGVCEMKISELMENYGDVEVYFYVPDNYQDSEVVNYKPVESSCINLVNVNRFNVTLCRYEKKKVLLIGNSKPFEDVVSKNLDGSHTPTFTFTDE